MDGDRRVYLQLCPFPLQTQIPRAGDCYPRPRCLEPQTVAHLVFPCLPCQLQGRHAPTPAWAPSPTLCPAFPFCNPRWPWHAYNTPTGVTHRHFAHTGGHFPRQVVLCLSVYCTPII